MNHPDHYMLADILSLAGCVHSNFILCITSLASSSSDCVCHMIAAMMKFTTQLLSILFL